MRLWLHCDAARKSSAANGLNQPVPGELVQCFTICGTVDGERIVASVDGEN